jgi:hypothetical protein
MIRTITNWVSNPLTNRRQQNISICQSPSQSICNQTSFPSLIPTGWGYLVLCAQIEARAGPHPLSMQKETFFIVILHLLLQHRGSTVTQPRVRHGHTCGCSRPLFSVPRQVGVDVGDDMGTLAAVSPVVRDNAGAFEGIPIGEDTGAPEEFPIGADIGVDMGALEELPVEEDVDVGRSVTVSVPCCEVMLTRTLRCSNSRVKPPYPSST